MLIYLDMCCLKRPFDDQSQSRIRLESEAVLGLLSCEGRSVEFVRSPALFLENSRNPIKERAARVGIWLMGEGRRTFDSEILKARTAELIKLGLKNFDALHVASAEKIKADVFASCDDRILNLAKREAGRLHVRVVGVVELAKEVLR